VVGLFIPTYHNIKCIYVSAARVNWRALADGKASRTVNPLVAVKT